MNRIWTTYEQNMNKLWTDCIWTHLKTACRARAARTRSSFSSPSLRSIAPWPSWLATLVPLVWTTWQDVRRAPAAVHRLMKSMLRVEVNSIVRFCESSPAWHVKNRWTCQHHVLWFDGHCTTYPQHTHTLQTYQKRVFVSPCFFQDSIVEDGLTRNKWSNWRVVSFFCWRNFASRSWPAFAHLFETELHLQTV